MTKIGVTEKRGGNRIPFSDVDTQARNLFNTWADEADCIGRNEPHCTRFLPTRMIFITCRDGANQNEVEHAELEHITVGAQVLASTVLAAANHEIDFGTSA